MAHPPRIPVWFSSGTPVIWFVTICEKKKRCAWDNQEFFDAFLSTVKKLRKRQLWFVRSAVVMPDHLHLLVSPLKSRDQSVGNLSGALKRWVGDELSEAHKSQWDWQPGAFDRLLRKSDFAQKKWEYMRENPVRAGLVDKWDDWPWTLGIREPGEHFEERETKNEKPENPAP